MSEPLTHLNTVRYVRGRLVAACGRPLNRLTSAFHWQLVDCLQCLRSGRWKQMRKIDRFMPWCRRAFLRGRKAA